MRFFAPISFDDIFTLIDAVGAEINLFEHHLKIYNAAIKRVHECNFYTTFIYVGIPLVILIIIIL